MTCLAKYFLSVTSKVMGLLIELDLALEAIFMLNFLPVRHNENDFFKASNDKERNEICRYGSHRWSFSTYGLVTSAVIC